MLKTSAELSRTAKVIYFFVGFGVTFRITQSATDTALNRKMCD